MGWVWAERAGNGPPGRAPSVAKIGRGSGCWKRKKEGMGERAMESRSYTSRKQRQARARALPDAADAKPGGANTTPQIIILIKVELFL